MQRNVCWWKEGTEGRREGLESPPRHVKWRRKSARSEVCRRKKSPSAEREEMSVSSMHVPVPVVEQERLCVCRRQAGVLGGGGWEISE